MKKSLAFLSVVAATAAVPAFAQGYGPGYVGHGYIGAGIGRGNLNLNATEFTGLSNATVGDTDTSWTIRAGWRVHPYFALEAGYFEFGTYDFRGNAGPITVTGDAKVESYSLSLVGILPLGEQFEGYGRVGYAHTKAKFSANTRDRERLRGRHAKRGDLRHRGALALRAQLEPLRRMDEERQDQDRQLPGRDRLPLLISPGGVLRAPSPRARRCPIFLPWSFCQAPDKIGE
jgi:hypothetical protein